VSARAAFAGVAAAVFALALVPWADSPLRRLAGGAGDGPDPRFDVPLDADALRAAEDTVQGGDEYATEWPGGSPLEQGNLKAAGQLYLSRAVPVLVPARAEWLLSVRDGGVVLVRRR
jgi:hypothetical protein